MRRHAKAPSAGSTEGTGNSRSLLRRASATGAASRGSKGIGAAISRRAPIALAALAVTASVAFGAAPASAADPSTEVSTISDVSYTSAHVTGKVTSDGSGFLGITEYTFQYSTDEDTWTTAFSGNFEGAMSKTVDAPITVPKGATKYFVRLLANYPFAPLDQATSPEPNPSFTTLAVEQPIVVATDDASEIFSTSAKASGKVKRPAGSDPDPAFDVTACYFEYVTDADFTATGFVGAGKADCDGFTPIAEPNGEQEVTAHLTGMKAATTYHLRLAAENAGPTAATKEAANTFTTLAPVAKPIVIAANDATDVGKRTAKVTGEIERPAGVDPALDTSCRFEYVTNEQFTATGFDGAGQAPCVEATPEAPLTSPAPGYPAVSADVSAELSGLTPGTVYHLRLTAENGGGTATKVAAGTFETVAVIPASVTVDSITEVGYQKARVTATADPGNQGIYYEIEYAVAGTEEWFGGSSLESGGIGGVTPGAPPQQFSKELGPFGYVFDDGAIQNGPGLKPGTTYKVRGAWRRYQEVPPDGPTDHSPEPYTEFTTKGTSTPPSASLDPITDFTGTTAHFTGTVDPNAPAGPLDEEGKAAYQTDWHFECTPECKGANGDVIGGTIEAEEGSKAIVADAKRLDPNTEYEVKLVVHNAVETVETPIQSFSTPLIKPTIKAAPGGSDGKGGYTLQGVVNPNNSPVSDCKFEWGPNSADYAFSVDCSPAPGDKAQPVTVEAHLTGLNPGVVYHYNLLATNAGGQGESGDQEFTPTLDQAQFCPNEQIRKENNSLALPECRAYEKVTPDGKEGYSATLEDFSGGDRVLYKSGAGNLAKSGQNATPLSGNSYVAARSAVGWETIPNLNGSSGTLGDAPSYLTTNGISPFAFSEDLLSSLWWTGKKDGPPGENFYLRNPDGSFTFVGLGAGAQSVQKLSSDDLSHLIVWPPSSGDYYLGSGLFEYVGTGNDQPRRVDVNNSGAPITTCAVDAQGNAISAYGKSISGDGRVIAFMVLGGCGGANPPTNEIWARVNGTTSFDVSASQCNRTATDPGGLCNGPVGNGACGTDQFGVESGPGCRGGRFEASTPDGSRIFFSTNQQLLDGDTDQTRDIYACDIPSGDPAPSSGKANHCAAFMQVSGAQAGADVESFLTSSDNGGTVAFIARGALADNEDVFAEEAVAGAHNLYVWRADAAHPTGQTTFVARLDSEDSLAQTTPDGRYLVFTTASQLLDTDTDDARDVYRYDAETGELTRASTNILGVAGNGGFDARISDDSTISDDGQKVVFTTFEALSPDDGNAEPDLYLWTPDRVSLISTGSVGGGASRKVGLEPVRSGSISIDGSGQNIYFETPGALTPADGDALNDVYVARTNGGFSFARATPCTGAGGACQSHGLASVPTLTPATIQPPADPGNVKSKLCPKGKIAKGNKCVRKKPKKHSGKKHHGKKAAHKQGGGK